VVNWGAIRRPKTWGIGLHNGAPPDEESMSGTRLKARQTYSTITRNIITDKVNRWGSLALRPAGIETSAALLDAVGAYLELLLRWNRKVNLTAVTDPDEILDRHFAESFFAARWLGSGPGLLCDIGSGAGFPGLALKMVLPDWSVRLYEPNAKKAAFLREVAQTLGLRGVEVTRERWQEAEVDPGLVDAVSARALGGYPKLVEWAAGILRPSGKLVLWLGEPDAQSLRELPGWLWEAHALPNARDRVLLIGELRG
jgi:16S rRNA (guanine527-N7)-methyltransferase